jgi:tetratricopeptide (TPR) repeat protein
VKKTANICILLFLAALCSAQNLTRGEELLMQNKPAEAVVFLENAIIDEPSNVTAYLYLGIVYEQLQKPDEAIATYRRILPFAGNRSSHVATNLANIYFMRGNNEMAEQLYTQVIESDPGFSRAWLGRANTRVKAGNLRNAASDYDRYLLLEPLASQRSRIGQLVSLLRAEFAAEERRRLLAEEEEHARAVERQRLLDEVSASLHSAADGSKGISSGAENVEGYANEFELE